MSEIATSDSLKYHLAEISVKLNNFVLQHHQNDFLFLNTTFLVLHVADFDHRQADFFHFQPDFFQNNIFSLTFLTYTLYGILPLIRISSHSLPEFSHFIPEENHLLPEFSHFIPEENHFTSKGNHFTSKGNHFTSKENHFTSEENHFLSKGNHFISEYYYSIPEENHKRNLVFQVVNQFKKFVEVAVEHTVNCISISLNTVLCKLHHSLRNFTVIMAENILKRKPNIQPVGATLLRASVELNCKEGTFINPKSIFYG